MLYDLYDEGLAEFAGLFCISTLTQEPELPTRRGLEAKFGPVDSVPLPESGIEARRGWPPGTAATAKG